MSGGDEMWTSEEPWRWCGSGGPSDGGVPGNQRGRKALFGVGMGTCAGSTERCEQGAGKVDFTATLASDAIFERIHRSLQTLCGKT